MRFLLCILAVVFFACDDFDFGEMDDDSDDAEVDCSEHYCCYYYPGERLDTCGVTTGLTMDECEALAYEMFEIQNSTDGAIWWIVVPLESCDDYTPNWCY